MKYNFTIQTTQHVPYREGRLRRYRSEQITLQVAIEIESNQIQLREYGYKAWWTEHNEGRYSALPGRKYRIFNSMLPKEGDVWKYRDRTFIVGKREGFLNYNAPLLENGKEVARVYFEDYYKD